MLSNKHNGKTYGLEFEASALNRLFLISVSFRRMPIQTEGTLRGNVTGASSVSGERRFNLPPKIRYASVPYFFEADLLVRAIRWCIRGVGSEEPVPYREHLTIVAVRSGW
jgi:hypothetical protein